MTSVNHANGLVRASRSLSLADFRSAQPSHALSTHGDGTYRAGHTRLTEVEIDASHLKRRHCGDGLRGSIGLPPTTEITARGPPFKTPGLRHGFGRPYPSSYYSRKVTPCFGRFIYHAIAPY
ncbi:hypothetical protein V2G26_005945 [Clonostachys chloroleuca]